MTRKELLAAIDKRLRETGEPPYRWGRRVLGDKAFLWKMKNSGRALRATTIEKIEHDLARRLGKKEKERAPLAAPS